MSKIVFELCAESVTACIAARDGGAARIELCCALNEDGLTPSFALIRQAIQQSGLPVHVLLRPRSGGFVYSEDEFNLMRDDLIQARQMGAAGFALGILMQDGTVDIVRTQKLVQLAHPLEVTFHRAFDCVPDLGFALEDVITAGCHRILTSGGKSTVYTGAESLAQLHKQAANRVVIAAGGGLRMEGAGKFAAATGISHFHGSVRRRSKSVKSTQSECTLFENQPVYTVQAADIAAMIAALQNNGRSPL